MNERDRKLRAFSEAGRAVIARLLGVKIRRVIALPAGTM
jgi:hypothetical protein